MPEGPEIETVRRQLSAVLLQRRLGKAYVGSKRLRWPESEQRLNQLAGRMVRSLHAHGKLLWLQLDTEEGLFMRLGMSGLVSVVRQQQERVPHTHICIELMGTNQELRYVDPRRFGGVWVFSSEYERMQTVQQLGPDPLRWNQKGRHEVIKRMQRSSRCIKQLLLDQTVVSGLGNIYACEALFAAKLSPFVAACHYQIKQLKQLMQCAQNILYKAVALQGTTFQLYRTIHSQKGRFAQQLQVFQREGLPCLTCKEPIQRVIQGGRSTFLCPFCQPNQKNRQNIRAYSTPRKHKLLQRNRDKKQS